MLREFRALRPAIALLAAVLLLSGCISSELSTEERFACIELTKNA